MAVPYGRRLRALLVAATVVVGAAGLARFAGAAPTITQVLGRPTHSSVVVNVRADSDLELFVEYGRESGSYDAQTAPVVVPAGQPVELSLTGLAADAAYSYRVEYRTPGSGAFQPTDEQTFHTQRAPGSAFTFAVQGDSHPERERNMFSAELYTRTLRAVAAERPDFYLTSGDDFSVDTLRSWTANTVTERYTLQLPYLGIVGRTAPLFLVNGNHEQAARYLLDGSPDNVAVWAQNARNRFYPQPAPDGFYSGNAEAVPHIGLLRNYFAWEWGDALFVVIDPYWSSPVPVDGTLGNDGQRTRNRWDITLGDAQYQWLKQTLEQSRAKWKFVFAHHVNGTGRGGVDVADEFEWGGKNANGTDGFAANRPGWAMPIHQLFVANKVTIFFQAHDHLFVRQELDGVVYQSLPNPADNTYTAFNEDAYRSGDKFPNAGYVKVSVDPAAVNVQYIRMFLPRDEAPPSRVSGMVQFAYTVRASQ